MPEERKSQNGDPSPRLRRDAAGRRPPRLFFFLALLFVLVASWLFLKGQSQPPAKVDIFALTEDIAKGRVKKVKVKGGESQWGRIQGEYRDEKTFDVFSPSEKSHELLLEAVQAFNVGAPEAERIQLESESGHSTLWAVIINVLPWILVFAVMYILVLRNLRAPGASGGVLTFGRSRAKLASKENTGVTFEDVAGIEEAKEEVQEIIEFLRNPQKFQKLGGRIPRGVLLVGGPGTGKTLLAKAIAGEADVPFFSICGSDFVEMFVGVGASRVRDLFRQARENSPCIIFLDEVDAVGRRRGSGLGGGHDEREQTLNAILVEMDGFDSDQGIILVAATNRPDVLDPALLRPGRFDREIVIDLPDLKGREDILRVHTRKVKLDPSVSMHDIARGTPTFSGAELAALVNEAALQAAMKNQETVKTENLEDARDKIRWGRQKHSRVMADEDRLITAYHEAGHALLSHLLPDVEPLHKVTIIPRGMALGATMQLPERDRYHVQRKRLLASLVVLYGGRVAEQLFCEDITSGSRDDIKRATELARLYVCEWGMSENVGPINYSESEEHIFLGREITRHRSHSEAVALQIDEEVRRVVKQCYSEAERIIREHRTEVEAIAKALLDMEVLTGAEVAELVGDRRPPPESTPPGAPPAPEDPE